MGIGPKTFGRAHGWDDESGTPSPWTFQGPLLADGTYFSKKPYVKGRAAATSLAGFMSVFCHHYD